MIAELLRAGVTTVCEDGDRHSRGRDAGRLRGGRDPVLPRRGAPDQESLTRRCTRRARRAHRSGCARRGGRGSRADRGVAAPLPLRAPAGSGPRSTPRRCSTSPKRIFARRRVSPREHDTTMHVHARLRSRGGRVRARRCGAVGRSSAWRIWTCSVLIWWPRTPCSRPDRRSSSSGRPGPCSRTRPSNASTI